MTGFNANPTWSRKALLNSMLLTFIFTIGLSNLWADSTLNFPRLSSDPALLTGVAIVNPNSSDASVTFTAFGSDGLPLSGPGISNPVTLSIPANQQFSKLTSELFGSSLPANAAWFQASSPSDSLVGFFLFLNPSVSLMDGADLPALDQKLFFNSIRVDNGFSTELNLFNPSSSDAHLRLSLSGTTLPPAPSSLTIPAHGAARLDAASFFSASSLSPAAFVIVDSDTSIAGFELVRSPSADAFALNARSGAERLSSLYFLQTSLLGSFQSSLSLINYSPDPVVVTISAYQPDGSLFDSSSLKTNPVTRALNPGSSLSEDLQSMFGFNGSSPIEAWILVKATSPAINGFLSYSDSSSGSLAAITSPPSGSTRAIFSHIASSSGFSTGLSLLNQGSLAANVRILAIQKDGISLGVFDTVLQPSQRFKRFLGTSDLIPQAANQTGGIIFVKSDVPIYMSSLITAAASSVNIPPQPAPDSYNPDSSIASLKMNPPVAIIPPGASQRFSVSGSSSFTWKVNGTAGGSAATGTISTSGVFTAPKTVPSRQVLTISAETTSQSTGASADVLDKVPFTSGLGVVQSVTYLSSLNKVYSAELAALSAAPSPHAAAPTGNSQIFEVPGSSPHVSIASFPGEVIPKIIPFTADNGSSFLLLAAQTSGRIIRLDPVSKLFKYVATGLNQPSSLVIDPSSGDLLVVELDKISTVPKSVLQADLSSQSPSPFFVSSTALAAPLLPFPGGSGIAVDRCTKRIYTSSASAGTISVIDPSTGKPSNVASGLNSPGQLLALYRSDVSCPFSLQILFAQPGSNEVSLLIPTSGFVTHWADAPGITDIAVVNSSSTASSPDLSSDSAPALLPQDAAGSLNGVLISDQGGVIDFVSTSNLYSNQPPNPPLDSLVESKVDLALSQSHTPPSVLAGALLSFTVSVSNKGPDPATGVTISDTFSALADFISASPSQGNCGQSSGVVTCDLGPLPVGASASLLIRMSPRPFFDSASRTLTNTASVSSSEVDTDFSNNSSTDSVVVTQPGPSKLVISGFPSSASAGSTVPFTLSAKDVFDNPSPGYRGTVRFTSSDTYAALPSSYTFTDADQGSHSFSVVFSSAGTQSLSAQDVSIPSISGTQSLSVTVSASAATSFSVSAGPATAGAPVNITVTAKDQAGNTVTNYAGMVSFSSSDQLALINSQPLYLFTYPFQPSDFGTKTFSVTFFTAGVQTFTATSGSFSVQIVGSTVVTVSPAALATFTVVGIDTAVDGQNTDVTVTARDAYGNVKTDYVGTITFSDNDSNVTFSVDGGINRSLSPSYQFTSGPELDNGIHIFAQGIFIPFCWSSTVATVRDAIAQVSVSINTPPFSSSCSPLPPLRQNSVRLPPAILQPPPVLRPPKSKPLRPPS